MFLGQTSGACSRRSPRRQIDRIAPASDRRLVVQNNSKKIRLQLLVSRNVAWKMTNRNSKFEIPYRQPQYSPVFRPNLNQLKKRGLTYC